MQLTMTVRRNKTPNTSTYYYNVMRDVFGNAADKRNNPNSYDTVVVDDTLSAQQIDAIFGDIYGRKCGI